MEFKKIIFLSFTLVQIQISAGEIESQPKDAKKKVSVAPLIIYNWMKYAKCLRSKANHQIHDNDKYFVKKDFSGKNDEVYDKCFKESITKQDSVEYSEDEPVYLFKKRIAQKLNKKEADIVVYVSTKGSMWGELYGWWSDSKEDVSFEYIPRFESNPFLKGTEKTINKAIGNEDDPNYSASIEQFEVGIKEENTKNFVGCVIS